jgi:hypothetical protein
MISWTMNKRAQVQIKDINTKKRLDLYQVQLVLMIVRDNVSWLSIYILDIYSTLLAAQVISKVVA